MAVIDWAIILVVVASALISLMRGFVKEGFSLATWILAFIIAPVFSANLATLLEGSIETELVRWGIAFAILFLGTLVIGTLLSHLLVRFIRVTGLSGLDRVLGMFFGVTRGLIILVVLVFLLQLTPAPKDHWWQESVLIPYLVTLADWMGKTLPNLAQSITSFS